MTNLKTVLGVNSKIYYALASFIFLLMICNSCSIQKKRYSKGFHVEWKSKLNTNIVATNSHSGNEINQKTMASSDSAQTIDPQIKTTQPIKVSPALQSQHTPNDLRKYNLYPSLSLNSREVYQSKLNLVRISSITNGRNKLFPIPSMSEQNEDPEDNIPLVLITSIGIVALFIGVLALSLLIPTIGGYVFLGLLLISNPIFEYIEPDEDNFWGKSFIWARDIIFVSLLIAGIIFMATSLPLAVFLTIMLISITSILIIVWAMSSILDLFFNSFE